MSNKPETSAAPKESQHAPLSGDALARRRALLSGLGKGGAVLAAAAPLQSLAGSGTVLTCQNASNHTVRATVSGCTSAAASFIAGGGVTPVTACGKTPKYWCDLPGSSWPTNCTKSTTTFNDCFGRSPPTGGTPTLLSCLKGDHGAATATWCAAYLNGVQYYISGAGKFPYPHTSTDSSIKGVKAWYTDTRSGDALTLFNLIQTQDT